jgi:hypothetical protein
MDATELIRIAFAGRGEPAAWNSLTPQYQAMMRAIARMRCPTALLMEIVRSRDGDHGCRSIGMAEEE